MKKRRYYQTGAVFELSDCAYMLTQIDYQELNLIRLGNDSNRWTGSVKFKGRPSRIPDCVIRLLIGKDKHTGRVKNYYYLGQFSEVFERMGL